jgi:hypothetical protein
MQSTSMGVQFEVNDLDASYELVGTSDNYSFQYKLGKGSDLVNDVGEAANEIIPLKGNYGSFEVKVFAVSDIGIRSEFILGDIDISPPTFEGTFTFNNLRILEGFGGVDETLNIEYAPELPGDELIVTQQFAGKSVQLAWELIPPVGHPREGQSVDTELLNDTFFSGIVVNIKNDGQLISQQDLGNSEALAQSLLSNDVVGILNNYRDFSLNLNAAAFNDLDLQRNVSVELVAVDLLGGTCTGTLSGYNPPPEFSNFNYSLRGSDISFSWFINDLDYKNIDINVLAVEKDVDLLDTGNYDSSVSHLQSINETVDSNKIWDSSKNVSYESGDLVLWQDNVYKALLDHQSSFNDHPIDGYPWENLGSRVSFETKSESSTETVFSSTQLWGYEYYYTFQAFDDFGAGDVMLLGEDGILQAQGSEDAGMYPYESVVQIGNLRYIEDSDDFVFNWNVVDQDGNAVDLNQYKFAFKESSLPTMLGLSGSLYDIQSNEFLTGITEGENGIGLNLDENGNTEIVDGLASTKVFDTFRFTRELNNEVYGIGGFPSNYSVFDDTVYYQQDDLVSVTGTLYKSITTQVDAGQKPVQAEYYDWSNSENYQPGDCAVYNGNIYQLNGSYGPAYTDGIFDFETLHVSGDLVVAPINKYRKFYESSLTGEVVGATNSGEFTTNLTNVVDNTFQSLLITINGQTKTIVAYDGYNKTITLDSDLSSLPQNGDAFEINGFEYQGGSIVVHNNKLFRSRSFQSGDTIATPGTDVSKWTQVSAFSQVPCEIYKCINANNFNPNESDIDWQIQDPDNSDKFDEYISGYKERVSEWSSEGDFFISDFVVYANDIWSGVIDSGPSSETGVIAPGSDSSVWVNNVGGQDIIVDYNQGDLVYALGAVYQAAASDPVGAPIEAISNPGSESLSTYQGTEWIPYWQRETIYDDLVFGHVGIPESGKRSVGIELGIVDSSNQVFSLTRLNAYNQEPSILPQGFNVDSLEETTKIKFNFNYAFQSQEKTTKVNLYRSSEPSFEITGADGLPYETIGGDSTLVKVTLGAADATFGENITQIVDAPPIPKINGVDQITGYYYKILPFDDFGSGDLFGVNDNQGSLEQCLVYPKNYSTNNPNGLPGPVYRTTQDDIPGPVVGFNGNVAFENFFLNWFHPNGQISTDDNGKILYNNFIPNDLSHYEVWISENNKLQLGSLNVYLKNQKDPSQPIDFSNDKGYRRIENEISSTGLIPIEKQDPASGITNATQAFTVSANGVEVETSYPGKTNDTRYFWVRPVDHAGNKGPFTGQSGLQGDNHEILGMELTLGVASATDIEDFEINMTESFGNTIALVPNNPFENNSNTAGKISWTQHYLFNEGTGFIVDASGEGTSDGYVWWDRNDDLKNLNLDDYYVTTSAGNIQLYNGQDISTLKEFELGENNSLKNVYFSGVNYQTSTEHPANNPTENDITSTTPDFDDGDFVIARNTNGIATPVYHAFANALIGTANIANAAIKTAHVNDLSADKIRAGTIDGHLIEITQSQGLEGGIATAGFTGINHATATPGYKGFLLSGDGSFQFQEGFSSIGFDNGVLNLRGNIQQADANGSDYDFVDINSTPNYFTYREVSINGTPTYDFEDGDAVFIDINYTNTSISDEDDIRILVKGVSENGTEYDVGSISESWKTLTNVQSVFNSDHTTEAQDGFRKNSSTIGTNNASCQLLLTVEAFDSVLNYGDNTGVAMAIYTQSAHNTTGFRKTVVGRVVDGAIGASVNYWFAYGTSSGAPAYQTTGATPNEESDTSWKDNIADLSTQTGLIWIIKGVSALGGQDYYTFDAPYQLEAEAVAEIVVYKKSTAESEDAPADNTIYYNFTAGEINVESSDWSLSPGNLAHGQKVYASTALVFSHKGDSEKYATGWSVPWVYAERKDARETNYYFTYGSIIYNSKNWMGVENSSTPPRGWITSIFVPTFSVSNGQLTISNSGSNYGLISQKFNVVSGRTYDFEVRSRKASGTSVQWFVSPTNLVSNRIDFDDGGNFILNTSTSFVVQQKTYTATSNQQLYIMIQAYGHGIPASAVFDYIKITERDYNTVPPYSSTGNTPNKDNEERWQDKLESLGDQEGLIWVIKGVENADKTSSDWGTPYQLEAEAVAEINVYKKGDSGGPADTDALIYNFTNGTLDDSDSTWKLQPAGLSNDGDKVYAVTALITSHKADSNFSIPKDAWSAAWVYAQRTDGQPGQEGRSPTYRGKYKDNYNKLNTGEVISYVAIPSSETQPGRGDVVDYDGTFYICTNTHNITKNTLTAAQQWNNNSSKWKTFGAQFESVATDILLAQDASITNGLIMGKTDEGGFIISNGFKPGVGYNPLNISVDSYATAGFLLGRDNGNNTYFDIGGALYGDTNLGVNSYIRFSSSVGKLEISSASFNGSINIGTHNPLDFQDYADDDAFASFVGGGYNNQIGTSSYDSIGCGIIAGAENTMSAAFSMIGAGYLNECNDNFSFIGGGYANKFTSTSDQNGANFIGAGEKNTINGGSNQVILGGDFNTIEYDPPQRYYYGQLGKFVASDSSYIIGGFAFGAGEEWRANKIYNTDDLVYVSIDNPENSLSLDNYFLLAGTSAPYFKQNKVWRRTSASSGQLVEGPQLLHSTYWRRAFGNAYFDYNNWMVGSWFADGILITESGSSQVSLDSLFDGRYPVRRHIGWCYAVNIGGSNSSGWAYVYVSTRDRQHPQLWVFFDYLTAYPSNVSKAWCWFDRDAFLGDDKRYFYQDGYGWKTLVN